MLTRMFARGAGIIENFISYGHTPKKILDIGGGIGGVANGIRSINNAEITILDRSLSARKQSEKFGFDTIDSISKLGENINKYDTIVMCQSLEHFLDPIGLINSIKTFLKKDIHLYIEVPNAKWHP
jgi:2-polyprenyl-3-methyl-5-hydroxy-6-metoxy-1,4-benzoquinol methylase